MSYSREAPWCWPLAIVVVAWDLAVDKLREVAGCLGRSR